MPIDIPELRFVLCCLAAWRLTHLVVAEDGPWDLIVRLRAMAGDGQLGAIMDCFYCTSLWIALPLAFAWARDLGSGVLAWLAISGAAALLEQFTNHEAVHTHGPNRERKAQLP